MENQDKARDDYPIATDAEGKPMYTKCLYRRVAGEISQLEAEINLESMKKNIEKFNQRFVQP